MSSGVSQSVGKNQHSEHVNMASNDGKMQNHTRVGGKNQNTDHPGMMTKEPVVSNMVHAPPKGQQYPYNQMAESMHVVSQAPYYPYTAAPNPTIHATQLIQESAGQFAVHTRGVPEQFQYAPPHRSQFAPPFPQQYYPQQYFQPHVANFQPQYSMPIAHPEPNAMQQLPAQASQPIQLPKKEKKILQIIDPSTKKEVEVESVSKPPSNNPTPNTTIDTEKTEAQTNFRKQFAEQVSMHGADNKIAESSNEPPVAQSEPKETPAPEPTEKSQEVPEHLPNASTEEPAQLESQHEDVSEAPISNEQNHVEEKSIPTVKLDPVDTSSLEKTNIQEPSSNIELLTRPPDMQDDDVPSLHVVGDAEVSSPSISVDNVAEEDDDEAGSPSPDLEEDKQKQEEEENERLRQRAIELDNLLEQLEQNEEECDILHNSYGRDFMYCIRDIEKEFKRSKLPGDLTLDKLKKEYGIDIHSMPKHSDRKGGKAPDFNPVWNKQGAQGGRKYPASGRNSHDHRSGGRGGGSGGKKPYVQRASIGRAPKAELQNKAENAWKAEKLRTEDLENEEVRVKLILKSVRSLLNKITPTTKDDLIKEFLALHVSGPPPSFSAPEGQLVQVVDVIFDKAVEEPKFCSLYAAICNQQVNAEVRAIKSSPFRKALLDRSQKTFVNKTMEDNKKAIEEETDEEKKKELKIKWEEEFNKFRRRKFGNINFIGQLYEQNLLSHKIIQWCMYDLLSHCHPNTDGIVPEPPYDDESLHCCTQLLEVAGKTFEHIGQNHQYVQQLFDHLKKVAPKCTPKIRFKILGVIELRERNWQQRKVVDQGPKKITEIHQDIQAEQQQLIQERESYDRKQSGVRQGSNSLRRNAPTARNSLDSRQNPSTKRAIAGAASKIAGNSIQPRLTSMSMTGKEPERKGWATGAAGGGGEAPGSRVIITRNSREGSGGRKSSTLEKESALAAARTMGNVNRSNSQLSIASQEEQAKSDNQNPELFAKIVPSINNLLDELVAGVGTLEETVNDCFSYFNDKANFGFAQLADVFQRFAECYIKLRTEALKKEAIKVLSACLLDNDRQSSKEDIMKGLRQFCEYVVEMELFEDYPNIWDTLSDLLVAIRRPESENSTNGDIDQSSKPKGTDLNELAPVFLASFSDRRVKERYDLLVNTLKKLAAQIGARDPDELRGLAFEFEELVHEHFKEKLDKQKFEEALKKANPGVTNYNSLYDVFYPEG